MGHYRLHLNLFLTQQVIELQLNLHFFMQILTSNFYMISWNEWFSVLLIKSNRKSTRTSNFELFRSATGRSWRRFQRRWRRGNVVQSASQQADGPADVARWWIVASSVDSQSGNQQTRHTKFADWTNPALPFRSAADLSFYQQRTDQTEERHHDAEIKL